MDSYSILDVNNKTCEESILLFLRPRYDVVSFTAIILTSPHHSKKKKKCRTPISRDLKIVIMEAVKCDKRQGLLQRKEAIKTGPFKIKAINWKEEWKDKKKTDHTYIYCEEGRKNKK